MNCQKSRFLPALLIVLICSGSWATNTIGADYIEENQPAPYNGIIFDAEKSEMVLYDLQKLTVVEEQCTNLEEQVTVLKESNVNLVAQNENLKQQLSLTNELLAIEKARTSLEKERAEFYKEQNLAKDKIIDQQDQLNQKLIKEVKKKSFWKSLAIGELFVFVGIIIASLF